LKSIEKKSLLTAVVLIMVLSSFLMLLLVSSSNKGGWKVPIRVACVGDSITEGTQYPADLQALLGSGFRVGNFGVGGSTVMLSSYKPYMHMVAFENAVTFRADVVVIMLGTNDAIPDYIGGIDSFVGDYKKLIDEFSVSGAKVFLVKPPPIFNDTVGPKSLNLVENVIPRIVKVADQLNLKLIDVYPLLTNHPDYFSDGVHPTARGAAIIAREVFRVISS
jgi:lysophospholipase L1-like esterase